MIQLNGSGPPLKKEEINPRVGWMWQSWRQRWRHRWPVMCWAPFKNRPVRCPSSQSCSDTWRLPVWLLCSLWEPARAFVTADTFISSQSIWKWRKNVMMHEKIASLWILSETNSSCSLRGTPDTTGVLCPGPATKNLGPAQKVSHTSGHWKCFVMLSLFSSKGRTPTRADLGLTDGQLDPHLIPPNCSS